VEEKPREIRNSLVRRRIESLSAKIASLEAASLSLGSVVTIQKGVRAILEFALSTECVSAFVYKG